jgi:lipopolysaccharide heptosyltransferase II
MANNEIRQPVGTGEKVLALSLSGIGNFLMHTPTLEQLKRHRSDWHITVWTAPRGTTELARHHPACDAVFEAPIKNNLKGHARTLNTIRRMRAQWGVVLSPGQRLKSAAYLRLAGIPHRLGHTYPLGNATRAVWLTHSLPEQEGIHDIEQNLNLLTLLNIPQPATPLHYRYPIPPSFETNASEVLKHYSFTPGQPLIALHPGTAPGFSWKRWPVEFFADVARNLITKRDAVVLIFGSEQENNLKEELRRRIGKKSHVMTTDILTAAALLKRCALCVSNDSGIMHLSAAVGTSTLGLFGPTDERLTGPRGAHTQALRAPNTSPIYHTEKNYDLGSEPHSTLRALTPQRVIHQLDNMSW